MVREKIWNTIVAGSTSKKSDGPEAVEKDRVDAHITKYNSFFAEKNEEKGQSKEKIEERKASYSTMVNAYYDLVTDFYEYGWGQSFHFAPRFKAETFLASVARHEHFLAARLGLKEGMKCLDVGCGIGGPMRTIARFSFGAKVVGINNNAYQVKRCKAINAETGMSESCSEIKGDFMDLPFKENTFDAAYEIEATCHAPDRVGCFKQILRVLKPGAIFAGYEWCMTDLYNPKDEEHRMIKHGIEAGDSLPDMGSCEQIIEDLKAAGFEIVEFFDVAADAAKYGNDIPWYTTLQGGWSLASIKHTPFGRFLTQKAVDVMETLRIAPKGTSETHKMLCMAANALARGGETGIFTPMFYFAARKPQNKKN